MVNSVTARWFVMLCMALLLAWLPKPSQANEQDDQRAVSAWIFANSHKDVTQAQASRIVKTAYKAAEEWKVDPLLLLAIMKPESNFQASARNKRSKASGLMQILPQWHRDKIGKRPIMQVETNVDVGAAIVAEYLSLSGGKLARALQRYSGGANKSYHAKIAAAYRDMKTALVLDRFSHERSHRTDHIFQQPGAYTASLAVPDPTTASVKRSSEDFFATLVASHP